MQEAVQTQETRKISNEDLTAQIEFDAKFAERGAVNQLFGVPREGFTEFVMELIADQIPATGIECPEGSFANTPYYGPFSVNPFIAMTTITGEDLAREEVRTLSKVARVDGLGTSISLMPITSVAKFKGETPTSILADLEDEVMTPLDLGQIANLFLGPNNLRGLKKVFKAGPVLVLGVEHSDNPNLVLVIENDVARWIEASETIPQCSVFFFNEEEESG